MIFFPTAPSVPHRRRWTPAVIHGLSVCLALIVLTRIPDLIIVGLIAVALCMVGWLVYMAWPAFRRLVDDMMSRSRSAWDRDADL